MVLFAEEPLLSEKHETRIKSFCFKEEKKRETRIKTFVSEKKTTFCFKEEKKHQTTRQLFVSKKKRNTK